MSDTRERAPDAAELASEFDASLAEAIALALSCSEAEWAVMCPGEQRTVGVLFDHIAAGNYEVVRWIETFLHGAPISISPEILTVSNAAHARETANKSRASTLADLESGTERTSRVLHGLSDAQLLVQQEFGWLGTQDVAFLARQGARHAQRHLKSIREALSR